MKRAVTSVSSAAAVTLRAQQGSAMMERVSETLRYLNSVQHSPSPSRSSVSSSSLKPSTNPSGRRQQTLADLASQAPSTREVSAAAHSSDHHHQFNYAERRAAQYYADTIRTLIFSCHYLSTSQFQCLQPQVSAALLTSTPTMSAISSERKEMHALGQELRRGNAMAYFSLLLRHRLPPVNYEDYKNMTQCLMVRRASKGGGGGDDDDKSVVASSSSIPVSPNTYPHIHASWEHSLALLSWAMMLNSGDRALPPSIADITNVLDSLTFHSGSRSSEGKPDSAMHTNRSDDSAVEKVKQLLDAAVQRRHACSSSSDATTSPSSSPLQAEIHTLGKKVHVTEPSTSSGQDVLPSSVLSHSPNLASEFLLKGQWECVLQAFSDMLSSLSGSTTTTTGSVKMTQGLVQASFSPRFLHRRLHDDETHHREVTKIIRAYSNNPREQQKQIRAYILRSAISSQTHRLTSPELVRFQGTGLRTLAMVDRSALIELFPFAFLAAAAAGGGGCATRNGSHGEEEKQTNVPMQRFCDDILIPFLTDVCSRSPSSTTISDDGTSNGHHDHDVMAMYSSLWDFLAQNSVSFLSLVIPSLTQHRRVVHRVFQRVASALPPPQAYENSGSPVSFAMYMTSLWLEAVLEVCELSKSLSEMRSLMLREGDAFMVSPECAAAFTCVIAHAASRVRAANNKSNSNSNSSTNTNSAESKQDTIMTKLKELLCELKPLSFIVPETKLPGFYFKWLYRDTFVAPYHRHPKTESGLSASSNNASVACCYTESSWNSPLGLLGGRCFRITSHLPSHARQEGRHPCKMVRYVLDTQRVVEHFLNAQEELRVVEQQQQQGTALHTKRNETPNVVVSFSSPEDDASGGGDEEREGEGRECGGLCVVYKPAGVASTLHASAPSVTAYLASCTSSDCNIPSWATTVTDGGDDDNDVVSHFAQEGLVNRIDRNTSGLLLAARDEATLFAMRRHGIAEREARKSYIALVVHCPPSDRSLLTLCGSRTPGSCAFFLLPRGVIGGKVFAEGSTFGLTMSEAQRVGGGGARSSSFDRREAVTEYTVLESFPHRRISLVRAVIRSGRRHQIRQHFASIHHPLVGDVQYHPRAAADDLIDRVALHAEEVCIDVRLANQNVRHDEEGDPLACRRKVVVTCDLPVDMEQALRSLRAEKRRLRR